MEAYAHLSSLRLVLSLMQAAMMMPDAVPIYEYFLDRSIDSVGLVPLSSSIGSGWPSTLGTTPTHALLGDDKRKEIAGMSGLPRALE